MRSLTEGDAIGLGLLHGRFLRPRGWFGTWFRSSSRLVAAFRRVAHFRVVILGVVLNIVIVIAVSSYSPLALRGLGGLGAEFLWCFHDASGAATRRCIGFGGGSRVFHDSQEWDPIPWHEKVSRVS